MMAVVDIEHAAASNNMGDVETFWETPVGDSLEMVDDNVVLCRHK